MDDDTQMICHECTEDVYLKRLIKREGSRAKCSFCSKNLKSISIESLADEVERVLSEHFRPGDEYPVWGDGDRPDYMERHGEPLDVRIGEILQRDNADEVVQAVCEELQSRQDWHAPDPLYEEFTNIVHQKARPIEAELGWMEFRRGVMHGSRFFNGSAKTFLDWLFKEIEAFRSYGANATNVVQVLEPGQEVFRARLAKTGKELHAIIENPTSQLFAPPPEHAGAGRMNPVGVPFFYGAFDRDTCIAELRPPVGGHVISGSFELTRQLRILNFKQLESAYEDRPLSMFQPDYRRINGRREFLRTLHHKISIPVLPNQEHEYLITQVIAEYLGTQHSSPLDGVIFSSAQHAGGLNIVLFPRALRTTSSMQDLDSLTDLEPTKANPALKLIPDSLVVHEVKSVMFNTEARAVRNGQIETFAEDYDDEWDY